MVAHLKVGCCLGLFCYALALAATGCARVTGRDEAVSDRGTSGEPARPDAVAALDRPTDSRSDRTEIGPSPERTSPLPGALCDLDEGAPSGWGVGCEVLRYPCLPSLTASKTTFVVGTQSMQLRCSECGADSWTTISPAASAAWDLSKQTELRLLARSQLDKAPFAWQDGPAGKTPWFLFKDSSGGTLRVEWNAGSVMFNATTTTWVLLEVPLTVPASGWNSTVSPGFDRARVTSVEIHVDPWDTGFTLWLDQVSFQPGCP